MKKINLNNELIQKKLNIYKSSFDKIKSSTKEKLNNLQFIKDKNILLECKNLLTKYQDKLEQSIQTKQEENVLSQSSIWAKSITWTLIGGTTFGLAWLTLAKTEEIVVATGKLEPIEGVVDVQMPLEGIAKEILVKEGDLVKKGQILIKLDTDISNARNNANQTSLAINKEILEKLEILAQEGAVAKLQVLQQQNKIAEIESQITQNEVTLRYQEIISPTSGIVFDLKPKSPGFVARTSEPVLKIVPIDDLKAKVEIPSSSIGFVTTGKKVDISIDSFPSTDFGVIEGVVSRIGSDALPPEAGKSNIYRFPADIKLNSQTLKMKTGKKLNLPLQAGMSLTANIKLRKVSYLKLLLGTFSDKADSLREL